MKRVWRVRLNLPPIFTTAEMDGTSSSFIVHVHGVHRCVGVRLSDRTKTEVQNTQNSIRLDSIKYYTCLCSGPECACRCDSDRAFHVSLPKVTAVLLYV